MADRLYYFYRCRRCFSLITRLQLQKALTVGLPQMCSCGSGSAGPTNPIGWEWFKPAVLRMVAMKLLGRLELAPEPSLPAPVPKGVLAVPALSAAELELGQDEEDAL